MITAYIVNKNGKTGVKNIENTLESYYRIIECTTIDIVSRRFAGRRLDVICDDEGLFTDSPVITAVDHNNNPMLVGTLIIVNHDDEGETVSLTQQDVSAIEHSVLTVRNVATGETRKIVRCDY